MDCLADHTVDCLTGWLITWRPGEWLPGWLADPVTLQHTQMTAVGTSPLATNALHDPMCHSRGMASKVAPLAYMWRHSVSPSCTCTADPEATAFALACLNEYVLMHRAPLARYVFLEVCAANAACVSAELITASIAHRSRMPHFAIVTAHACW